MSAPTLLHRSPSLADVLAEWVSRQRWYAGKPRVPQLRRVGGHRYVDPAGDADIDVWLARDVGARGAGDGLGDHDGPVYQIPVTCRSAPLDAAPEQALIGTLDDAARGRRWVYDGLHDPAFVTALLADLLDPPATYRSHVLVTGEQSNSSMIVELSEADPVIVKVFRTVAPGPNPDVEIPVALRAVGSADVPEPRGATQATWPGDQQPRQQPGQQPGQQSGQQPGHTACAHTFIEGARDGWSAALAACRSGTDFTDTAAVLGALTARLHHALADAFGTTATTGHDVERLVTSLRQRYAAAVAAAPGLGALAGRLDALVAELVGVTWPRRQRVHGDFHLGQVLIAGGDRLVAVDFEGEPMRPLAQRRQPDVALRDVAGMLRSFDYVTATITGELSPSGASGAAGASLWAAGCRTAYLEAYYRVAGRSPWDTTLVRLLEVDKALYEVVYEARNRPGWVAIPVRAVHAALADPETETEADPGSASDDVPGQSATALHASRSATPKE